MRSLLRLRPKSEESSSGEGGDTFPVEAGWSPFVPAKSAVSTGSSVFNLIIREVGTLSLITDAALQSKATDAQVASWRIAFRSGFGSGCPVIEFNTHRRHEWRVIVRRKFLELEDTLAMVD